MEGGEVYITQAENDGETRIRGAWVEEEDGRSEGGKVARVSRHEELSWKERRIWARNEVSDS